MPRAVRFLIGLAAVLLFAWLYHGPLGNGAAFIDRLERETKAVVAAAEVPGTQVRFERNPLGRVAILSGPANRFQREGQGELKGLNDIVRAVPGVSGARWSDEAAGGTSLPLLLELVAPTLLAYLLGVCVAGLVFGRPKRESYLS